MRLYKYVALILGMYTSDVFAANVVFIPSAGSDAAAAPRGVPSDGADPDLCRSRNSLPGLNMTRKLLGVAPCSRSELGPTDLGEQVDLLILVDDTSFLSDELDQRINSMLGENLTCATDNGRRRVYPSYVILQAEGNPIRALVVGEAMIDTYFLERPVTEKVPYCTTKYRGLSTRSAGTGKREKGSRMGSGARLRSRICTGSRIRKSSSPAKYLEPRR